MTSHNRTLRTPAQLYEHGFVPAEQRAALEQVAARYAVAMPPALCGAIDRNDPHDPIARQIVPDARELEHTPDELADPIGDDAHSPVEGIVHRYPDRVLLKLTHVCAVYCRFCFRREMVGPGEDQMLGAAEMDAALAYIASHPEIWEVIVTGGDPFTLSPRRLAEITGRLAAISHVKTLRWHTRMPVADPTRVTDELAQAILSPKPSYVAIHVNHPRELTKEARDAAFRLIAAGSVLLSQSVLLKGVNDNIETLEALMRALVEARIQPYYLHHMDLAPGTSHFRTTIAEGQALMRELRARASGLCQPHYVLDIPGGHAKALLTPCELEASGAAHRALDAKGHWHDYPSV
jgi:lysine 2,3-aminomutase